MNKRLLLVVSLALGWQSVMAVPKRSRAEAVPGMETSNTVALGDIWLEAGFSSQFQTRILSEEFLAATVDSTYRQDFIGLTGGGGRLNREVVLYPRLGAIIGLGHFLHIQLNSIPWDGSKIGASSAQMKITSPGNDNLRLFGIGASVGAVFTTEENSMTRHQTTPGFDPFAFGALMIDLDLIKLVPDYPFKMYFNYFSLDEQRLAHSYRQHSFKAAFEYKGYKRSYYLRGNFALYKPKSVAVASKDWEGGYRSASAVGFGFRKSMGERFSMAGELSFDPYRPMSFYRSEFSKPPRISLDFTVPLLHKESRTEALRALIFHEHLRKSMRSQGSVAGKADASRDNPETGEEWEKLMQDSAVDVENRNAFEGLFGNEEEMRERRRKIRDELKEIEELLE